MPQTSELVKKRNMFSVKGFDWFDRVKYEFLRKGFSVKKDDSFKPETDFIELSLGNFTEKSTGRTPTQAVTEKFNTTSMLASALLTNQDQIPESWRCELIFPGTLWTHPSEPKYLAVTALKKEGEVWVADLINIDDLPISEDYRPVLYRL